MESRSLTFDRLDSGHAERVKAFVQESSDIAASIDDPSPLRDLGQRVTAARDRGELTSLEEVNRVASGPDEFEALAMAGVLGSKLSQLHRRHDVANRQVGLDLVILNPATNKVHILNATATAVWYHLTPDRSLRAVVDALVMTYPQSNPPGLVHDVLLLLEELSGLGLLVAPSPTELPARADVPEVVTIPDVEISSSEGGYVAPAIKSFDAADLEKKYSDPGDTVVMFSDFCQSKLSSGWASDPNGPRASWADRRASAP